MGLLVGVGDFGLTGILNDAEAANEAANTANSAAIAANTAANNTLATATTYQQQIVDVLKVKQPATAKKRIIAVGSSVAQGYSADTGPGGAFDFHGYVWLLGNALTATHELFNLSQGGTSSTYWIQELVSGKSRLENAIIANRPDYVLIGLNLRNEGILDANKDNTYTQLFENIQKMVVLCRANGAVPVVMGNYPSNAYTSVEAAYYRTLNRQFGTADFLFHNFAEVLDDGAAHLIPSIDSGDGIHPNNAGHTRIFETIPLDYFRRPPVRLTPLSRFTGPGLKPKDTAYGQNLDFANIRTGSFSSFTFSIDLKANISSMPNRSVVAFYPTQMRIRQEAGVIYLGSATNTKAITIGALPQDGYITVTIKYNKTTNTAYGYLNGVLKGTFVMSDTPITTFGLIEIGNNGLASQVAEMSHRNAIFYTTPLPDSLIEEIGKGTVPTTSLSGFWPMNDSGVAVASTYRLANLAPTNIQCVVACDVESAATDLSKTISVTYNGGAWTQLAKVGVDLPSIQGSYLAQVAFSTTGVSGGGLSGYVGTINLPVFGLQTGSAATVALTANGHANAFAGRTVEFRYNLGVGAGLDTWLEFRVTGDTTPTPGPVPVTLTYRRLI